MKIKITNEMLSSLIEVLNKQVERVSYPNKIRFYYEEDNNFVIEIFDKDLIEINNK